MTHAQPQKKSVFNMNVDLMHGPILKSLLLFMLPILVSNLFQQLYNTVDTMIVGNVLGDSALAAIGSCGSIYELLVGFGLGIGNGLAIVAARSYGAQDHDLLKKTVAGSLVIGLIASLCITLAGAVGLRPLLVLLDTPAEILEDAYRYIIVIDYGVLVMFAYNLCAGLLRAIGNSFMPLVFLLLSSGLNILLDLLFIARMGMGVQGAAVATVISQGVSVLLCIAYVFAKVKLLLPEKKHFRVGRHLHGPDEQHRLGGLGRFAVWHQWAGHTGHRRAHRRPQDVHVHRYAAAEHGVGGFDLCFPKLRCGPAGPRPQGDEGDLPLLGRHDRGCGSADAGGSAVDGGLRLRLQ